MIVKQLAQKLLANGAFDIEFHGYLSNHVKHAIVALDRLDAPDARIQEYWDIYTASTPYGLSLHSVEQPWEGVSPASAEQWTSWRGQKKGWQEMVKYLEKQDKTSDELVKEFAPDLLGGIAGALTHGIIHLGWGVDAESPWMVMEGLAYLNFCYVPMAPLTSKAIDEDDGISSLTRIADQVKELDLQKTWVEKTKAKYDESFHPELVEAGFQWQLAKVLKDAHPVATNIPTWIQEKPLEKVYEELYKTFALVYLATRNAAGHGNFVVLHLLTSLWGLEKVSKVLGDESTVRKALETYWAVAICTLSTAGGFPARDTIEAATKQFPMDSSDDANFEWSDIVERGCAEEEEHNIKLVYVGRELWRRYNRWSGFSEAAQSFTETPNISPKVTAFSA